MAKKVSMKKVVIYSSILISIISLIFYVLLKKERVGYYISENFLEDIKIYNANVKKLQALKNKAYLNKEDLVEDIEKKTNALIKELWDIKNDRFISIDITTIYYPDFKKINKECGISDSSKILKKKYYSFEELFDEVEKLLKCYVKSDFYQEEHCTYYQIKPLAELFVPSVVVNKMKSLSSSSFRSIAEFSYKLKKAIGAKNYQKYEFVLSDYVVYHDDNYDKKELLIILFGILGIIASKFAFEFLEDGSKEIIEDIKKARTNITKNPDKLMPVWELANGLLEKYFDQTLSQNKKVFNLSISVMVAGFLLIVLQVVYLNDREPNYILMTAGIITEFIGATFLFIYKSTIGQSLNHSDKLERMANVGMSMKIIESIDVNDGNIKEIETAKIDLAKVLISSNGSIPE